MRIALTLVFFTSLSFHAFSQCNDTEVIVQSETGAYGYEMSWEIYTENGVLVGEFLGGADNTNYDTMLCLTDGCYRFEANDSYGDGWNGGTVTLSFDNEVFDFDLLSGSNEIYYFGINEQNCTPLIPGCTDPNSLNYDPAATIDDGSCLSFQDVLMHKYLIRFNIQDPKTIA